MHFIDKALTWQSGNRVISGADLDLLSWPRPVTLPWSASASQTDQQYWPVCWTNAPTSNPCQYHQYPINTHQ